MIRPTTNWMLLSLLFLLFGTNALQGQPGRLMVPFQDAAGNVYPHALAGGLTNPQFSAVDLNGDGQQDLIYFDRQGEVVVPWLNGGTPNAVDYTYAPDYAYRFPKVENWMLLRDYNCDGIKDIFSYSYNTTNGRVSVGVYKGSRDAQSRIQFVDPIQEISYQVRGLSGNFNLLNSTSDLPGVDDIDGDGDLDILNFNSSGGYLELFKNESQERGWGCDSLAYVYHDNCWGRMYESGVTERIDLSPRFDSCAGFPNWIPVRGPRHAGSTILTLDMDNDGDKEVMLGDLSFTNLNLLTNGGNKDTALLTAQEIFFPQASVPANIDIFPAAFYEDVNNDGAKDLLAAPNIWGNSNDRSTWYYQNTGTANFPAFTFEKNDFLVADMIDVGTGSAPEFWDYNGDGLLDILVGNFHTFLNTNTQESYLSLYENIGTATQPVFRLVNTDLGDLKQYGQRRLVPTVGDLDGDGDQDLIVGLENGQLLYVENRGSATTASFTGIIPNYASIDVGQHAAPQLIDADRDGDLDLVIGERNGNTNYFENTGSSTSPTFSSSPTTNTFGLIDTRLPATLEGNSAPKLVDINGRYHLFMATESGELWQYNNVENNLMGTFTRINTVLDSIDEGEESIVTIADINADGQLDFLMGNRRGGLSLFTEQVLAAPKSLAQKNDELSLLPNPAQAEVQLVFTEPILTQANIQIYNALGQTMLSQQIWIDRVTTLPLTNLSDGIYWLQVQTSTARYTQKLLIAN